MEQNIGRVEAEQPELSPEQKKVKELAEIARKKETSEDVLSIIDWAETAGIEIPQTMRIVSSSNLRGLPVAFPNPQDLNNGGKLEEYNWNFAKKDQISVKKEDYTGNDGTIGPIGSIRQVDSVTKRVVIYGRDRNNELKPIIINENVFAVPDDVTEITSADQLKYLGTFSLGAEGVKKAERTGNFAADESNQEELKQAA